MKRTLLVLLLVLTVSIAGHAQYVAIPDSNFGKWLNTNGYASCLSGNSTTGWSLDTTCSAVVNATTMDCSSASITNLTGVEFFRSLTTLNTFNNHLISLPALPASLTDLNCSFCSLSSLPTTLPPLLDIFYCGTNQLSSLPILPATLSVLDCPYNQLARLPALPSSMLDLSCNNNLLDSLPVLPSSLTVLSCAANLLHALPLLPASLTSLFCADNQIDSLRPLPPSLSVLSCENNMIRNLPSLPASLEGLGCDGNTLRRIPALPSGLVSLSCRHNLLTSLPALPAALTHLYCDFNQITGIPTLPASLDQLSCDNNLLTGLPVLPAALTSLSCAFNQIRSLPNLPMRLNELLCANNTAITCLPRIYQNQLHLFNIAGTNIQCLPSRFSAQYYDVDPSNMPLCTASSGCDFYYNISGIVHQAVGACATDSANAANRTAIKNVKVQLKKNGAVLQQFYTFNSGGYSFMADSLSSYDVVVDTNHLPYTMTCPATNARHVTITAADSVKTNEHFGLICQQPFTDYSVAGISAQRFRPGRQTQVSVDAGENSYLTHGVHCSPTNNNVTISWSGPASYVGPAPGALTPSFTYGTTLQYNNINISNLTLGSLDIILKTDSNATIGTPIYMTVQIPYSLDPNPVDNTFSTSFTVVNSYDPNYKEVSPAGNILADQWLTYTVHFQNTGTDTAHTVLVRDTLSQYLDASSFTYIASSSLAVIQLMDHAATFTFPHINLPDSVHSFIRSQGWIQYNVKVLHNVSIGSQIKNTASIIFDNNNPVVTNTVINTLLCTPVYDTIIRGICSSDSVVINGHVHRTTGISFDTISLGGGCDSIVMLNLTVTAPMPVLSTSGSGCMGADSIVVSGIADSSIIHWYLNGSLYRNDTVFGPSRSIHCGGRQWQRHSH